ncbi:hypothetical protein J2W21_002944 [Sinomonas atrocyanea]|uniref:TPM domain-containing protein n=1 Tax=Sinomonas atrocyanea TaxID=37927 RepID=UPI00278786F1|nr:TPM domain-containing protein [Sinomonas atrocyanea]MDP9885421.1 hypothetical protein [Sinomonas atrocyanea]
MCSTAKTLLAGLAAAILLLVPAVAPAWSADPVTIPSGTNIVDPQGALGSRKDEVQKAISDLLSQHRVNLYVVIVDSFTNPSDRTAWAQAVAKNTGMGGSDVLLAIATSGQYQLVANTQNAAIYPKISTIAQNAVTPNLAGGKKDYAQAAIDTAKATGDAAAGGSGNVSSGSGATPWLVGGGVVLVGAGAAYFISRRRKGAWSQPQGQAGPAQGEPDPLASLSVDELGTRAAGLLVRADDAVRSSEQELGFAEASYGSDAVGNFTRALAEAKAHLAESFKLQQQLDDHVPDTEAQQRQWLGDIIHRSEAAIASLAEQKADFDALRELERNAPAALAEVARGAAEAESRLAEQKETLARLQAAYAESAVKHVSDNVTQAQERLAFVENASATAREKLGQSQTSPAAIAVRAAEEALHQARVLLEAIGKAASALDDARSKVDAALADTRSDLAQARALTGEGQHPELAGPIAAVEAALGTAERERAAEKPDPIALLQRVESAHTQLDAALTGVRDRQQQAQRAAAALQQAIQSAQAQISAAGDYIAARRGGVGTQARTRLAEAQRNLDYALSIAAGDPASALAYAQQANLLAAQAAQIAEQDVDQFAGWGGGPGRGGMFGGGGLGGAVLGGIIIDSILRGGHHDGGGWGGGGFGGGWGGGGGGFGGGGDFGGDGGSF